MVTYVYTDGCCKSNGSKHSIGGYGIFFGCEDPRNIVQKIEGYVTNNIAELSAIIHAIDIVKDYPDSVIIYTDSNYAILCCTTYGKKCQANMWKNPNHKTKTIPNVELVKKAYTLTQMHPHISFEYIKAHTNLEDIHSMGNQQADRLANLSIL